MISLNPIEHPLVVFVISLAVLTFFARIGVALRKRRQLREGDTREYGVVESATLTLLGLIIAFTFSMAIGRFDDRKKCEATEANTIGTEYLRVDLLPPAEAAKLHGWLLDYLDQRISYYVTRDLDVRAQLDRKISALQTQMWSTVETTAGALPPNPVIALAVSGMNEAIDAQGFAQAAFLNRIPTEAWGLLAAIAIFANLLLGYTSQTFEKERTLLLVMPMILSIAFFMIADIDSPRWGLIHVHPQNLESLAASLHATAAKP
jgi:hypothetical protein